MTLDDIYNQLSFGELRQLFMGGKSIDNPNAGISTDNYARLLPSIQLGITELHKRFLLREGHAGVPLRNNQVTYVLYIPELFKVERIYGTYREKKYEIPLNEVNKLSSIRTTSYNTLMVPTEQEDAPWLKETSALHIVYRQDHPIIDRDAANDDPACVNIELPMVYMEPLLLYVASRLHNPVGMVSEFHQGNNYAAKFEASVAALKQLNFEIDTDEENNKLCDRGFV
jgi:hypothetical protein